MKRGAIAGLVCLFAASCGTPTSSQPSGAQLGGVRIVAPTSAVAGIAFTAQVTVVDKAGNALPGYAGTVTLTSSDSKAVLPAQFTFAAQDNGAHAFTTVALATVGAQTLTATESTQSLTAQASVAVGPGLASKLQLSVPPQVTSGTAVTCSVSAFDAFGNPAAGYTGNVVLTSSDEAATLTGPHAFTATDAGKSSFECTFATAGAQTLTASDGALSALADVQVGPGAAARLDISALPASVVAGDAQDLTVTAFDAAGNKATGYAGAIQLTSSDTAAQLAAPHTFDAADQGVHLFTGGVAFHQAGAQSVTASDGTLSATAGTQVSPGPAASLTLTLPASANAGASLDAKISLFDRFGNAATGYLGTVGFFSSDTQASLPSPVTFTAGDAGTHTLAGGVSLRTVGAQTVTASDAVTAALTATSQVNVLPAVASQFALLLPSTSAAGTALDATLSALDPFGNVAVNYAGTVHFTSDDGQAGLPAAVVFTAADHGVRALPAGVTLRTAGDRTVTATDTAGLTGHALVEVSAGPAKSFDIGGLPAQVTSQQPASATVTARDAFGNTAVSYRGTVHFTSSDPTATLPPDATYAEADAGAKTFTAAFTFAKAGAQSLTAIDAAITGTANTLVGPGAAAQLKLTGLPGELVAGVQATVTVTALDAAGNVVTGYLGTAAFTSSDPKAVLPAAFAFKAADLGVHAFPVSFQTAGAQQLQVSDGIASGSQSTLVDAAAASRFQVAGLANPSVAGAAQTLSVTAFDPFGNVAAGYRGTAHFTSTDAKAALPADQAFTATDGGVHAFAATLRTAGSQTVTAADGAITGSQTVQVSPAAASSLQVAGFPSPQIAGVAGSFTVTALDAFGNTAIGYPGTIHFTSNDAKAVLPGDFTFGALDAGVRSFAATLKTANPAASLAAADSAISGAQQPIIIKAAAAQSLTVAGFPSPATAGVAGTFSVTALDAFANVAAGYTGAVHFTSNDAKAVLPANYTFVAADAGAHSFPATLSTAASAAAITAADALITGTQQPIIVKPAAAASLVVAGFPSPSIAGVQGNFTLTAFDGFGNVATGYAGTVHFSSNDTKAVLPATATLTAGTGSFAAALKTAAAAASISATDTILTGTQQPIVVNPAAAQSFRVAGFPSPTTAGVQGNFTVTALDAFDNVATGYLGVVRFDSNDAKAALPIAFAFTPLDGGVHSFPATFATATNAASLTAADTVTASITGTQSPIVVNPAAAKTLTVAGFPTPRAAGVAGNFTVTAFDAFANVATGYAGTVHFSSSDAQAALPANATLTSGTGSFSATLKTATAVASLTATDTASVTIAGTQQPIVITPAAAASITVNGFPTPSTAGVPANFTVAAFDGFGNAATGYAGTVHFTSNDAKALLPANYTFVAADAGLRTFPATLETATATAQLTASDGTLSGTQQPIVVRPAGAQSLRVAGFPSPATAGAPGSFIVTALDAFANVATGYTGIVHFTSNDSKATLPVNFTFTATDAGAHSFAATLATVSATASLTATDLIAPSITGTQQPIVVKAAGAATLVVSGYPSPHTAGAPGTFNVTAFDAEGNIAAGYVGAIHFTSNDPNAALPANYTFLAADGGSHDFSATFETASSNTSLIATDTALASITGKQQPIVIAPGAASSLVVAGFPTPSTAGVAGNFTVSAFDDFGNIASGYTGAVHFTSNDAKAALPANFTFAAADAGIHIFSATLKTATAGASLTATDTTSASIKGTQQPVIVNAAAAASFTVAGFPAPATAGVAGNFTVTALDAFANVAIGYSGTVHFTSNDAKAALPANATLTAGAGTFPATLKTATSAASLTATDVVNATITGTQQPIAVNAASAASFTVAGFPNPATAGVAGNFTVTAFDAFANVATGYAGTVHFTSNDPNAVLPANSTLTSGTRTFPATLKTASTNASLTATDSVTAAITGTQQPIVVAPAGATRLTVTGFPSPSTAGVPGTFVVTAVDGFGNVAAGYAGTVHFTSSDAKAVLPANLAFTALDGGAHSFVAILKTAAGAASLTATDTVTAAVTGTQQPIAVNPAAAASLSVSGFPSPATAGVAGNFTVTALDAFANVATGYTGTVHFTSNDVKAVLPANAALTAGAGSFVATLKTATSAASLTATDTVTAAITGTQQPIAVTPAGAAALAVNGFPALQIAGVPGNFNVTAFDAFNNVATGYAGTVHFTSNDAKAVLPANATLTNGAGTFPATLETASLGASLTATDTVTAAITGTQQPIVVAPAPAKLLTVSGFPTPQIAGVPGNFNVTAFDNFGNVATGYAGTVHFTSSDLKGVLPANFTFTAADAGAHSFSATLLTASLSASLTATDTATATVAGTQSPIAVNPAGAAIFTVAGFPTPSTAGAPGNFTVTAFDAFGNQAKGYAGTVHFTSNDAQAVLPANATLTAGAGTFSATLKTASLTASLTATDGAIAGSQAPIVIKPANAASLTLTGFPSPQTAGAPGTFNVKAFDAFNNLASGYTGTLQFTSNDTAAVLPSNYTFTALDAGQHSFPATLVTASNTSSLTATDIATASLTATQQPIVIRAGTGNSLILAGFATPHVAGVAGTFTVTAQDAAHNTASGYTGTVHFTSNDAKAVLPADYTFVAADAGVHTFSAALKTATTAASLTATDTSAGALSGTQSPIVVTPAAAAAFTVAGFPSPSVAGFAGNFTVTALDAFANVAIGYSGTVHFTSSDPKAVLPANATLTAGAGTFPATLKTATSAASLTATDTVTATIAGTQQPIAVTPAGAATFTVAGFPTPSTAGVAGNFTVTALDAFANVATGYRGLVHFTSSDSQAVLSINTTLTNGTGLFLATLKTATTTASLTATDTVTASITGTQSPVVVLPAAAKTLRVSGFPSPSTAGVAGNFNVTALDAFGNVATGYTGPVHFTTSDLNNGVPANAPLTNGAGTFPATLFNATNFASISATDTTGLVVNPGTQSPIVVVPAAAVGFTVAGFPNPSTAGVAGSFTVTAGDRFGNVATGYAGTVHFTSNDPQAALPANATLISGAGTFSATLKTAGSISLTATDTVTATITGSQTINVHPAGAVSLTVSNYPSPVTAGVSSGFTVTAFDPFGNKATGYTGLVHFTSNDTRATLPGNFTFTPGDAGSHTFAATLVTATTTASLTAADLVTASITGTQSPIVVKPAAAKTLTVSGFPTPATAGVSGNFSVTAFDSFGNVSTGYAGTLHFTSNDAKAVLPANATLTNGAGTFSATLKTAGSGASLTATDTVTATITGTQQPIAVNPAGAVSLTAAGFPSPQTAGIGAILSVTAFDAFGNTATGYGGTIHFTSNDAAASLPANYTFVATDNGARTFVATLKTATNTASLTATDIVTASITGTQSPIAVVTGGAVSFSVSGFPTPQTAGVSGSFTVKALDGFGNVATNYAGTVRFSSNDTQATLPANATLTAGVGTFPATLKTAGSGASLTATDTLASSITGTQSPIVVNPAAAARLAVTGFPSPITAGTAGSFTVRAFDNFNNLATGYTGAVHFTSSDAQAVLPANAALTAGVGTFSATLRTASTTASLTATDTVTATITGTQSPIDVVPGAASTLTVSGFPSPQIAGNAGSFTVTALDAFGNRATAYLGTIHLTSNDAQAALPANYLFLPTDAGQHAFAGTLKTVTAAGSLTATDLAASSITGTQSPIVITPAAAAIFTVAGFPSPSVAGVSGNFTVKALDAFGNTATGYRGTVKVSSNDGLAVLPANYTFVAADPGTHTFPATLKTATTTASLTATDTVTATLTGTQQPIIVTPGAAAALTVSGFPTPSVAGAAGTFTVKALDGFGNVATGYAGTVHFTSNDAQAVLPANAALTAGTGTFPATLKTATTTASLTASDGTLTGTQSPIVVTPAGVSAFVVSGFTTPHVAGVAGTVTVKAVDQFNNTATGYTGTVKITSNDANAVLPANAALTAGVGTFTVTLKTARTTASITATDTVNATITGTQSPIVVTPGPAALFIVTGYPSPTTAGTSNNFTVNADDAFGNVATGYAGTIHFTSTDAAAALPANATLTAGTGTFAATLKTAGTFALTATDTVTASITGTQAGIVVLPGAAASLTLSGFPSPIVAGTAGNFTVKATDAFGNAASGYRGTVNFTSNDAQAALPAAYTFVAGDAGAHAFSGTLKTATTAASLRASDGALTGTQSPIVVTPAAAKLLVVNGFPNPAAAGVAGNVSIRAVDSFNNTATGYLGTVHLTSNDTQAVLPANYTFVAGDAGNHSLSVTLKGVTATASITATDTVTATIAGTQSPIAVTAGPAKTFTVSGFPNPATAGIAGNVSIKALDAFGNTATGYVGTVKVTSNDPAATLPANYTFVAADAGIHSLSVTLKTVTVPGQTFDTITATDTVTATITGAQTGIAVVAGAAVSLSVSGFPNPATAGIAGNLAVFALDAFGNVAGSYRGTVHFTASDATAVLPANYTFLATDGGVHSFVATLKAAGTQTLTATDTVTASITGAQTVTVNPGAPRRATFLTCTPSRILADGVTKSSCTITFVDNFGNPLAGQSVNWAASCLNFNTGASGTCASAIFGSALSGTLDSSGTATNTFATTAVEEADITASAGGISPGTLVISMPTQVAHGFSSIDALNLNTNSLQIVRSLPDFADLRQDQVVISPTTGLSSIAFERFVVTGGNAGGVAAGFNTHDMWVSANSSTGNLTLFEPTVGATGGALTTSLITAGNFPTDVAVGSVGTDTTQDIVVANRDANTVDVFFGSTNGTFATTPSIVFTVGVRPRGIAIGQLPSGQKFIAVANEGSDTISVIEPVCVGTLRACTWQNQGITISLPAGSHPMGIAAQSLAAGGQIAVALAGTDLLAIYSVTSANVATNTQTFAAGLVPTSVAYGFYNSSQVSLAVGATLSQQTSVYSVSPTGTFANVANYSQAFQVGPVIWGDSNANCGQEIYVSSLDGLTNLVQAGEPFASNCPIF
jgi:hypothetical protein